MTAVDVHPTQARWWAWLDGIDARMLPERPVGTGDRIEDAGEAPPELFARQIFVRADLEERRSVDLLLVALLDRGSRGEGGALSVELVVVGPDALRAQLVAGPSGFTVAELPLAPVAPRLLTVSVALVRVSRAGRSRDVLGSIEGLGRLLDYAADPEGSAAVAHALVRRLEVLTSGPGVRVSVAGVLRRPADPSAPESLYLIADAALRLDDEVELRDGRLTVVTAAASAVAIAGTPANTGTTPRRPSPRDPVARDRQPWTGGDYVLLRTGRPATRQAAEARPLWQRRQEHALTDVGLGTETAEQADSYSSRAAAVRQAGRAQQIVEHAVAGDAASAAAVLASALTQPGAEGPLVERLVAGITEAADFWALLPVVRSVRNDPADDPDRARIAALLEEQVGLRLDHLLGLGPLQDVDSTIPVATPIILEVSDALVPIVDQRSDGGYFLYELIPAMRDRVRDATGVVVPGVRSRGNPNLAPGGFAIQIDEIVVAEAVMRLDGEYAVRSVADEAVPADTDVTDLHPLSGAPGRWRIDPVTDAADGTDAPDPGATFSRPQYLIQRLERVIRASLGALLGVQEVDTLLGDWRETDSEGVRRALVGRTAQQRLTVLLQDLVVERVPIADWRAVLDAVADAGGIDTDLRILHRSVRWRLRHVLPGPRTGPAALRVPADLQADLQAKLSRPEFAQLATETPDPSHAQIDFLAWLRRMVQTVGPVLSVIVDDASRPMIAALIRVEGMAVLTWSDEEVTAE